MEEDAFAAHCSKFPNKLNQVEQHKYLHNVVTGDGYCFLVVKIVIIERIIVEQQQSLL